MDKHPTKSTGNPIESIMTTTMENIKEMVDVNTVIGDPIQTPDGSTVIPISRVCFGFVAGGGEYACAAQSKNVAGQPPQPAEQAALPFAGGTGAGVTVHPMGFLVVNEEQVRLLPAQYYAPLDRIIEMIPQVMCEIKRVLKQCKQEPQDESVKQQTDASSNN